MEADPAVVLSPKSHPVTQIQRTAEGSDLGVQNKGFEIEVTIIKIKIQ